MAIKLVDALKEVLLGWRDDLPAAWRPVLQGVEPDFPRVDKTLLHEPWEPIFPARKGKRIPGAPSGAHVFRALDGVTPAKVRAVVVGQDPYPNVSWATGRAFDQGDLQAWHAEADLVSLSLRRIVPCAVAARTGDAAYTTGPTSEAWARVTGDVARGALDLQKPRALFDHWQTQGVLFLNTGLTLSRFVEAYQKGAHIPLWRPIIAALLTHLATRTSGQVVFMLWGQTARDFFAASGVKEAATQAGTWDTRVRSVSQGHPADKTEPPRFFKPPNTFQDANQALTAMGAQPIDW